MASPQTAATPASHPVDALSAPGRRGTPLREDAISKRLRAAEFDEETVKRRDKDALLSYITKLESEDERQRIRKEHQALLETMKSELEAEIEQRHLMVKNELESRKTACERREADLLAREIAVSERENVPLLRVKKLTQNAVLPSRASPLSAGYDLSSSVKAVVFARGKALIPTDLSIAIPQGTYARIAPRSGLAWKHAIDVGAGVIDADYRGPISVILFNHSDVDFEVSPGDRMAQLIIERIMMPEVVEVLDLDSTTRGDGGFGSTGV